MDDLVQTLLDRGDESTWAVFADHLQEAGDVRGELWALEKRLGGFAAGDIELSHQRNRILAAHVANWLGPLIAELDREGAHENAHGRELRALERGRARWAQLVHLPRLFRGHDRDLQLSWRAGFVVAARVRGLDERTGRVLESLLACPAARLLSCLDLDFDHFVDHDPGSSPAPWPAPSIRAPGALATLRHLRLAYLGKSFWPAAWLGQAAPNLRRLSAENADLSGLEHARIERLRLGGERLDTVLGGLGRARLPGLVHLTLDHFERMAREPDAFADFLSGTATPALRVLCLGQMNVAVANRLLDALAGSKLVRSLAAVELEWPEENPGLARLLTEYRAELGGLGPTAIRERAEPFCAEP